MGSYLIFNKKENNTKSISYPMAAIIRDVLPEDLEKEYGWILKKEQVAMLVSFTLQLLNDDDDLQAYVNFHKEDYGFDHKNMKEIIERIHRHFTETIVEMILNETKYIEVKWE